MLAEAPAHATQLFDDAVDAGADAGALAGVRAEASALAGDEERALALAHAGADTPESTARATIVLAGLLAAGASGPSPNARTSWHTHHPLLPPDAIGALRTVAAVAVGHDADDLPAGDPAPAVLGADVARLLGRGALAAGSGDADRALRATAEAAELVSVTGTTAVVLPETPHALGAMVALAVGDSDEAVRLAAQGVEAVAGGPATEPTPSSGRWPRVAARRALGAGDHRARRSRCAFDDARRVLRRRAPRRAGPTRR